MFEPPATSHPFQVQKQSSIDSISGSGSAVFNSTHVSSTDGYNTEEDNHYSQVSLSARSMSSIATTIESVSDGESKLHSSSLSSETDTEKSIKQVTVQTHEIKTDMPPPISSSGSSSGSSSYGISPLTASLANGASHTISSVSPSLDMSTSSNSLKKPPTAKMNGSSDILVTDHFARFSLSESEIDENEYFDARSPSAVSMSPSDGERDSPMLQTTNGDASLFSKYRALNVSARYTPMEEPMAPEQVDPYKTDDPSHQHSLISKPSSSTVIPSSHSSSGLAPSVDPVALHSTSSNSSVNTANLSQLPQQQQQQQQNRIAFPLPDPAVRQSIDSALSIDQKTINAIAGQSLVPFRSSSTHSVTSLPASARHAAFKQPPNPSLSTQGSSSGYRESVSSIHSHPVDVEHRNSITSFHRPSFSFSSRRKTSPNTSYQPPPPTTSGVTAAELQKIREAIVAQREAKRRRKEFLEDERVLVGTKVAEGHANFVTAYNMLTGIRVSVSRCNAKVDRELTSEDFTAAHKLAFDISGNELTPSAKYDFKFKDYSPNVFRHLRELFKLDPADYLVSLTSKYIVSELGSPGKSGSFFYFSRDFRFIIKTIHHNEHKMLRKVLKDYYEHVKSNPNTLISQFYGLHRVKLPFGRKIHFIVMNNLFPPHRDIHRTYDLKGSTLGREFVDQGSNPGNKGPKKITVYKDVNWVHNAEKIQLGPSKRAQFLTQLEKDVALLKRLNVMDYSLLVGIHDLEKGNSENIRDNTLRVFEPGSLSSSKVIELRKALSAASPTALKEFDFVLDEYERKGFTFYSDSGGFRATGPNDEPLDDIYYMGVIDYLTPYTFVKKVETFWKGLSSPRNAISAIPASEYGDRFLKFIKSIVNIDDPKQNQKNSENESLVTPNLISPSPKEELLSPRPNLSPRVDTNVGRDSVDGHLPRLVEVE